MADIKERKRDTGSIKEKRTSAPKELLSKSYSLHSVGTTAGSRGDGAGIAGK